MIQPCNTLYGEKILSGDKFEKVYKESTQVKSNLLVEHGRTFRLDFYSHKKSLHWLRINTCEKSVAVPLPAELERMQDSRDFLPQVPQVDAVIS